MVNGFNFKGAGNPKNFPTKIYVNARGEYTIKLRDNVKQFAVTTPR